MATEPNDLGRYFIERANAGDVAGLVALYEPNAVLAFPPGNLATGHAEIRRVYEQFVAAEPVLSPGRQHPALVSGDLAMTAATLTTGEVTVEGGGGELAGEHGLAGPAAADDGDPVHGLRLSQPWMAALAGGHSLSSSE